jgi:hypothetical protein
MTNREEVGEKKMWTSASKLWQVIVGVGAALCASLRHLFVSNGRLVQISLEANWKAAQRLLLSMHERRDLV